MPLALQRSTVEEFLMRTWARRGLAARLLWPLSCVFGALSALRRLLYRLGVSKAQRLPVPVVVVGNIFVGGTGKTPLTIWLVQTLRQAGFHPAVISRGYGGSKQLAQAVTAQSLAQDVGDEPLLIAYRAQCPVMVGRQRASVAQALLAAYPEVDVIISDDGLQHYGLARDIEIVLFDARGVGNGWLLPAGPLREPVSRRRDFTVLNGSTEKTRMAGEVFQMRLSGVMAEPLAAASTEEGLACARALRSFSAATTGFSPARILAAAGIGNPQRFFAQLSDAGLQFDQLPLPDHYAYLDNPFADVIADVILITEKDAVKCRQNDAIRNDPRIWVVPVTAQLDSPFAKRIVEKLHGYSPA
jgi:tetraacyldisaccharide 4'-kinase